MKCPACGNDVKTGMNYCSYCGWEIIGDASILRTLFSDAHLKEYETRLALYRTFVKGQPGEAQNMRQEDFIEQSLVIQNMQQEYTKLWENSLRRIRELEDELEYYRSTQLSNVKYTVYGSNVQENVMLANQGTNYLNRGCVGRDLRQFLNPGHMYGEGETNELIEDICERIRDGSFENLELGDFFDVELLPEEHLLPKNAMVKSRVRFIFAGFYHQEMGAYAILVAENCLEKPAPIERISLRGFGISNRGFEKSYMRSVILRECERAWAKFPWNLLGLASEEEEGCVRLLRRRDIEVMDGVDQRFPLFRVNETAVETKMGYDGKQQKQMMEIKTPYMQYTVPECVYWLRDEADEGMYMTSRGTKANADSVLGVRPYICIG